MSFVALTQDGKSFIRSFAVAGNSLISGSNKYPLPLASEDVYSFTAVAYDHNNKLITTNTQLCESLIIWFDKYCKIYDLDANIIAAQCLQESVFKIWNYSQSKDGNGNINGGAIGLTQFTMQTIWDVIISNNYTTTPKFTTEEIGKLTINVTNPTQSTSFYNSDATTSVTRQIAKNNRLIIHQNVMNNPELMVKAQCRLMKKIADLNDHYASSSLFLYNRASGYSSKSYTEAINKVNNKFGGTYIDEGLNYVKKIFCLLADKNNQYGKLGYRGYSFGYDGKIDIDPKKFDSFVADQNNGYNE